jgi:flagellar protein FlaG
MEMNPTSRIPHAAPVQPVPAAADRGAHNREVVQAVRALNQAEMFGQENQLEFHRDSGSRRMVIRIVNRNTREVVSQVPPDYVLRLAQNLNRSGTAL